MRHKRVRKTVRRAFTGALALACLAALLFAALQPPAARADRPPYFAIRGAKIVPVSGPAIEGGTVVIANGLIAAVGKDVPIPPEAWVIDGKGLTVYPGLIDALTSHGLAAAPARPAGAGPGGPPAQQAAQTLRSQGPEDRPGTTPWESAADELNASDTKFTQWRNAGFTTVLSAPTQGIFPGAGAVINTAGDRPGQMVVRAPATLQVMYSSPGGFTGFPGSLMGTIAYIKQMLHDADRYDADQAAYAKNMKQRRPQYDRAERIINRAMRSGNPVLLPGNDPAEMGRTIAIAEEFKLKAVLYGGQRAYEAGEMLGTKKYPVLVNLRWPEKQRDADPEAEESLATLRFRANAPSSPAALQKAGVKFAFYSGGITAPADIVKAAKKSIDAGLPADAALRAFTLSAAEILGVADVLGSIEPGKIANLVVTDGDIFNERTKVKMVFVDGALYETREPERPAERPAGNLTGQWTLTFRSPQGEQPGSANLTMAPDGTVTGTVTSQVGTSTVSSGWLSGNRFNITLSLTMGGQSTEAVLSGTLEGNTIKGTVSFGPASIEFTGTRPGGGDAVTEGGAL